MTASGRCLHKTARSGLWGGRTWPVQCRAVLEGIARTGMGMALRPWFGVLVVQEA